MLAWRPTALPGPRGRRTAGGTRAACAALAVVLSLAVSSWDVRPAYATPREELTERASAVKRQVDALDAQMEILSEDYNAAAERHAELKKETKEAGRRLEQTTRRADALGARLATRAESMYRGGPMLFLEVLVGTSDFDEFAQTWDFLQQLNADDAKTVRELKVAKAEQQSAERLLQQRTLESAAEATRLARLRDSIEGKIAERKQMLSGLEAQVAELDRAEERRRAATAARALRSASGTFGRTFPTPTRAARSEVITIAKRYLGAPYKWGAAGPDAFDCSGFTMFVYRQVGVQLPRVSRDQINAGQRVSKADLQPGDLVFFGNPIHHVGIYVGQGLMIHSPKTGDVVKISPMHSDFVGATRP